MLKAALLKGMNRFQHPLPHLTFFFAFFSHAFTFLFLLCDAAPVQFLLFGRGRSLCSLLFFPV